jgi:serine protease
MHRHPGSLQSGVLRRAAALIGAALLAVSCGGGGGKSAPQTVSVFTIGGTISVPSGTVADSDVNNDDPATPFTANNTCATAQVIPNPVLVGGYVNLPGAGEDGRLKTGGDVSDFYRVSLAAGQVLRLETADKTGATDLDLFVDLDRDGTPDDSGNVNPGGVAETITVSGAGDACVKVAVVSGASNYVLTIGQSATGAAAGEAGASIGSDFVPGEVLVRFREDRGAVSRAARGASLGLAGVGGVPGSAMLMRLPKGGERADMYQKLGMKSEPDRAMQFARDPKLGEKWETLRVLKALRARGDVLYAEPNYLRRAFAVPDDTSYGLQWHYPLINLPQAWDAVGGFGSAGAGVTVAVIDTGVVLTHPDLAANIAPGGYDFISDTGIELDSSGGPDGDPSDPGDDPNGRSSFHGTHVAGTIAAVTNNGSYVAGIAGAAKVLPLRVLGKDGVGTSFDIDEAVKYAAGLASVAGGQVAKRRADILNLSLGGGSFSQAEQDVFNEARARGVIVVAAAGNEASSTPSYPAAYDGVVSVSAVDINKGLAFYSNSGSSVDVAAPGGDARKDLNGDGQPDGVMSTRADDSSGAIVPNSDILMGTSMAAPHVAGVAALMMGVKPSLTPLDFDAFLVNGALTQDIGAAGRDDKFGNGLIDASKAVAAAGGTSVPAALVVTPGGLNFGVTGTTATLSVVNGGGGGAGALTVGPVTADQPWLTVTSPGSADGLGSYTISANRGALPDGTHTAKITFPSNANSVTVNVILQKLTASPGANAGRHYILLLDSNFNVVNQTAANAVNGQYAYSFGGVRAGDYFVVAGSDANNDGFICDAGEACGAYPTLDQPSGITVGPTATANFFTGFESAVSGQASAGAVATTPARAAVKRLRR